MVRWGAAGGLLGAIGRDMADGAHILAETVLHRQLRYYAHLFFSVAAILFLVRTGSICEG